MAAGLRDKLVSFQHAATLPDEYNEPVPTWEDLGEGWAAIFWGRGDERRQAAAEQGQQAATFQVLANGMTRAVTVKDRIVYQGDWDIVGIAEPKRGELEFSAVRAA